MTSDSLNGIDNAYLKESNMSDHEDNATDTHLTGTDYQGMYDNSHSLKGSGN